MSEGGATPRVLVIGLNPYRVPGPWDPKPVADAIDAGMRKFAEHRVSAKSCLIGLDAHDDADELVTDALRADAWDCVIVGGGIRAAEDQLRLLERVINLVRIHAPDAAIAGSSQSRV